MLRALVLCRLPLIGVGCSGDIDNLPTTPDPVFVTETFTGTLNINGGATHNVFTSAHRHRVSATLTSLGDNPPAKVGFSMGTLGCGGTSARWSWPTTTRSSQATVTGTVSTLAGSLCVRVYDVGALTESVPYTFTVSHP